MELKVEQINEEEYADSLTLTSVELMAYDIPATYEKVMEKLRQFKIARNTYINGVHIRLTPDYRPRLECFTQRKSDPVGNIIDFKLDSEQEYNEFNFQLGKLYSIMSKGEIAYINDCLLCGKSVAFVRDKLGYSRDNFAIIKDSAIVRFGIVFNLIVYK